MSTPSPASSPAPASSAPTAPNASTRRSFTLPARAANRPKPPVTSARSADGIETLFTHTSTRIVSFSATVPNTASGSRAGSHASTEAPATIPWKYPTERTLAVGVLRIYRVTSSNVSFLNSNHLLHTIFPRSQCWCVDGGHIFVLRIRPDSYYRIELPLESDADREKVDEFKHVLSQVLHFERTRCPFKADTEIELPERPKTPPRRRTKRPSEKVKKWTFDKTWMPEDVSRPYTPSIAGSDSGTTSSYEDDDKSSVTTDVADSVSPARELPIRPIAARVPPSVRERAKTFQQRAVTAPISTDVMPPAQLDDPRILEKEVDEVPSRTNELDEEGERPRTTETISLVSSTDSFYSLQTDTHANPSPHYVDAKTELANPWTDQLALETEKEQRGRGRHRREISEVTIRARSAGSNENTLPHTPVFDTHAASTPNVNIHLATPPSTPPLVSDSEEGSPGLESIGLPTPPDTIRMKRLTGASQRRAFSPMPQPQNLFCAPARGSGQKFTTALVRKTCEILLGPPAHLVQLMLNIAASITNGAFGFNTYRIGHHRERIPCSWESSDEEEDEWTEDDYGIPLGNVADATLKRRGFDGEVE